MTPDPFVQTRIWSDILCEYSLSPSSVTFTWEGGEGKSPSLPLTCSLVFKFKCPLTPNQMILYGNPLASLVWGPPLCDRPSSIDVCGWVFLHSERWPSPGFLFGDLIWERKPFSFFGSSTYGHKALALPAVSQGVLKPRVLECSQSLWTW